MSQVNELAGSFLLHAFVLSLVGNGAYQIIGRSGLFAAVRDALRDRLPKFVDLMECPLCTGGQVGLWGGLIFGLAGGLGGYAALWAALLAWVAGAGALILAELTDVLSGAAGRLNG